MSERFAVLIISISGRNITRVAPMTSAPQQEWVTDATPWSGVSVSSVVG